MRNFARAGGLLAVLIACSLAWYINAADYSDQAVLGTYRFSRNGEVSTLVLRPDHVFEQELSDSGRDQHATGNWRRIGEGGVAFSKKFLVVSGQELEPDGTAYGDIHKKLGLLVSLTLRDYHVLWYGKVNPSASGNSVLGGAYEGDEPGVSASLTLKPDHTFEQTVSIANVARHTDGTWKLTPDGNIAFSKEFLKTSGEALTKDETALARDPKGSNLQIEITTTSKSGAPVFQKRHLYW